MAVAAVTLLTVTAVYIGCGEEDSGSTGPTPGPGQIRPVGVLTANDNVSLDPTIYWHRVGGDNDSVVYDFYIGTSSTPSATRSNLIDTCVSAGPLLPGVSYRWAVRARINGAATAWSDVYSFGTVSGFTYPMTVGNRWEYLWEHRVVGLDLGDRSGFYVAEIMGTAAGWAFDPVYVLQETWYDVGTDTLGSAVAYYTEESNGLYLAGYDGAGFVQPSAGAGPVRYVFNGREFRSPSELLRFSSRGADVSALSSEDIIYENPPKRALRYPIASGIEWNFRTTNPFAIKKSIHAYESLEVPAGRFGCFVVNWQVDQDNDGVYNDNIVFHDYIAEEGLIRRSVTLVNVMVLDEFGTFLGYVDIVDEYSLVALKLE